MFPDCYYDHGHKHFSLIHDTGEDFCSGHPLRYIGTELLSKYEPGKKYSPRAKLPPSWQKDLETSYPVDSCIRSYKDWASGYSGVPSSEVHFIWLLESFIPFATRPGQEVILPDNMLGLPPVTLWPVRGGPIPWVLDPAEHPRPDNPVANRDLVGPGDATGGGKSRKRKRHHRHCELGVTQKGVGDDESPAPDSGVNLASPVSTGSGKKKRPRLSALLFRQLGLQLPPLPPSVPTPDGDWMRRHKAGMNPNRMTIAC